jgi:hypothetical protein
MLVDAASQVSKADTRPAVPDRLVGANDVKPGRRQVAAVVSAGVSYPCMMSSHLLRPTSELMAEIRPAQTGNRARNPGSPFSRGLNVLPFPSGWFSAYDAATCPRKTHGAYSMSKRVTNTDQVA